MSRREDFIEGEAELGSEEDDESFDGDEDEEEDGPSRRKERTARVEDSSEEEDDDDDEEEAAKIREGFIVDESEEEEEGEGSDRERKRRKKRRRAEREEEAQLDEEDLDLIGESRPDWERQAAAQPKFKRLKRGHRDEVSQRNERPDLTQIFSDEEDDVVEDRYARHGHRQADDMDDFIEEDFPEDEDERLQRQEDLEVARPRERFIGGVIDTTGLDKDALDDMDKIFGDGGDYAWVFDIEDEEEERGLGEQGIELKDVFEPSQLQEKLMTDEDNKIRYTDEPERFQIDRKPFRNLQITPEQFKEEARWVINLLWPTKQLSSDLHVPFSKAVGKVLEFFVVDDVEVPYVFQHRKDYLIHARKSHRSDRDDRDDRDEADGADYDVSAEKLLNQDDLWRILDLDIKFRSLIEKRNSLEKSFDNLRTAFNVEDKIFEEMVSQAATMEELQDLQDYLHFQYAGQLRDLVAEGSASREVTKRPGAKSTTIYERIRKARAACFAKAYGISPDRLAQNALRMGKKVSADDDPKLPVDLADSLTDDAFATADGVILAARQLYAEELAVSPRMRKHFRIAYYVNGLVSCRRTEKGLRKIDESHPFYEIKYLIDQTFSDLARRPELFLKMMKAEEEGLVDVTLVLQNEREFRRQLYTEFASDNFSELADAWNEERQKVLDLAFPKIEKIITKGVKDTVRTACQDSIQKICRDEYSRRLDQAPFKPKGLVLGTTPRVLALSNGLGDPARDPVYWSWVEEDGRVLEHGRFGNLARDDKERDAFAELVQRRRPDVIGVSGFSADTHKLVKDVESLVHEKGFMGPEYDDPETNEYRSDLLEVVVVNDEVARLYKDSERAVADHPSLQSMTRYCVALARYMQNPMKEYAALGKDVQSLMFHPCQNLLPADKLARALETAMVDMVNLCGVDINEAVGDAYTANLLPFVSGLGPRKAVAVIKGINANGGVVNSRDELVGDPDSGKLAVVGPRVWNNCASFLYIEYDSSNPSSDPLDNTRVHPEDYELGRKMAADALELDEEDVKAETDENGPGAIVRKLFKEDEQERVNELILEEYAEQLVRNYNQRKRATLESIRAELQAPYEELRRKYALLSPEVIFSMFTGESQESLCEGMIIPVYVRVVKDDFAIVRLDCGVEGRIEAHEVSHRHAIRDVLRVGQTVQAKLLELNRKDFISKLSVREDALRRPYRKFVDHARGTWDFKQEDQDREDLTEKDKATGRTQRVIKHPLFRPFNATQAEEYLGSQAPGDMVIRPSSRGNDHLVVTWKVADGVYEHLDVLELQKDNEFSVGRLLRIGGKYTYTDLDELIVEHVKAMAKKVDELTRNEKFQPGSRADTEKWLTTYMDANPNRSTYAFCIDTKHPGYFFLCFKVNRATRVNFWPVRVIPKGFELLKVAYPDMRALTNGFKMRYQNEVLKVQQNGR
ncbi:transcription elongation factor [Niveomyces insectorum RCEF 264]|uniref:Transcription elongation factor Spt6 n=1 Tax=Niveomyces insectorum RCEF 264 TaxID=1081102 RepID=A0A167ZZN7_9HYPO|nr:transcription elongation factor [Niveomyces insectorum RCEF 264]